MRIAQEEIFGPTTALIPVRDFDEAIRVSNGIQYGLSSSIFTRDVNRAFRAMRDLEAGITYINAGTIGAEVHLPFGGIKDTGNGHREAGQAALDVFTEWKSIYVDYSGKLQRAQIDNGRVASPVNRKLVVFVPPEALDAVRDAVFAAGAGRIGDYERCSWYTEGTGTFFGGEGTDPTVGEAGGRSGSRSCGSRPSFPDERQEAVVAALRRGAPVRGAGFDVYRCCEGAPLHRRRLARQPRPGRLRLRARGRGRHVLAAQGEAIGVATNNVAEYRGLIAGLEKAVELRRRRARGRVRLGAARQADARRVQGQERGAAGALAEAARLARRLGNVSYKAVRREHNELADRLVNEALGRRTSARLYWPRYADVAQLARASACHAEGRGFESHHPLSSGEFYVQFQEVNLSKRRPWMESWVAPRRSPVRARLAPPSKALETGPFLLSDVAEGFYRSRVGVPTV